MKPRQGIGWRAVALAGAFLALGCESGGAGTREAIGKTQLAVVTCEELCGGKTPLGSTATSISGVEWRSETIGTQTGTTGCACYDSNTGTFAVASNGQGPGHGIDQSDQVQLVYADLDDMGVDPRNIEIVVRVVSSELEASSGVMIREGMDNCDRMAAAWLVYGVSGGCNSPAPGVVSSFQRSARVKESAPVSGVPAYCAPNVSAAGTVTRVEPPYFLRFQRIGDDYAAWRRRDGGPWVSLGGGVFKPESEENLRIGFFAGRNHMGGGSLLSATFQNVYVGPARLDFRTSWIGANRAALSTVFTSYGLDAFWVAPDGSSYKYFADGEMGGGRSLDKFDAEGNPVPFPPVTFPHIAFMGVVQGGLTGYGERLYVVTSNNHTAAKHDPPCGECPSVPPLDAPSEFCIPRDFTLEAHSAADYSTPTGWTDADGGATFPSLGNIRVGGIAANDQYVYVSDRTTNRIRIFDAANGAEQPTSQGSFLDPGPLAVDSAGRLWVARTVDLAHYQFGSFTKYVETGCDSENFAYPPGNELDAPANPDAAIYRCDQPPCLANQYVEAITGLDNPTALAVAPSAPKRLLVALNGEENQNVQIYNVEANPALIDTLGEAGGVFASGGLVSGGGSEPRFFSPIGVGMDTSGDIYVASSGHKVEIQKFSPAGATPPHEQLWDDPPVGLSLEPGGFYPVEGGADFFTLTRRFALDLDQTEPGSEWSSTAVTWNPFLVNRKLDGRFNRRLAGGAPMLRKLPRGEPDGQRFMFLRSGMVTGQRTSIEYLPRPDHPVTPDIIRFYRFPSELGGEIAIPAGSLEMQTVCDGEPCLRLWVDDNGDGRDNDGAYEELKGLFTKPSHDVDDSGNIWLVSPSWLAANELPGIWQLAFRGLNGHGAPIYSLDAGFEHKATPAPALATAFGRYDSETDTMYIVGSEVPPGNPEMPCGQARPVVVRHHIGTNEPVEPKFWLPDPNLDQNQPNDFQMNFCGICDNDSYINNFDIEGDYVFIKLRWGPIFVYDKESGAEVVQLFAGAELSGAQDVTDSFGIMAVQAHRVQRPGLPDEYLVTTTDTSRLARTIFFRWTPTWSPAKLEPVAWYRADGMDVVYDENDGNKVVRWADRSGNGRDAVQPLGTYRPTYVPNGWDGTKPTVRFDGNTSFLRKDDWGNLPPLGPEQPYTILVVTKASGEDGGGIASFWGEGSSVTGARLSASGTDLLPASRRSSAAGPSQEFVGSSPICLGRHVLAFSYDGAGVFKLTVDGVTQTSSNQGSIPNWSGAHMFLLGLELPNYYFEGDISELVIVPKALDVEELDDFRTYAQTEWGGSGLCPGEQCSEPSECSTGYCVSGICCQTPCVSDNSCVVLGCGNFEGAPPGSCEGFVYPDGTSCDDGDPATSGEECQDGECTGGIVAGWTPEDLSPTVWFEAASNNIDDVGGGAVRQWFDQSGNDHHVAQFNGCCQPTFSATGWNANKPTITFNGTTSVLDLNPWPTLNPIGNEEPYTVLAVMRATGVQSGALASWWGTGGLVGAWLRAENGNLFLRSRRANVFDRDFTASTFTSLSTSPHVVVYRYDGAGTFTFTVDGVTHSSSPPFDPVPPMSGGNGQNQLLLGWEDAWGTGKFKGDISELVVVPENIPQSQVENFRLYAQTKWGGLD